MVSQQEVNEQLERLSFNVHGWGRTEVTELKEILLPDEKIFELANGFYEGGFALVVATDIRVLLIDKKPMKYLTVEDLRFDMINEIDYNHRLVGATISIATGNRTLRFTSLNKERLRRLITHVQNCMADFKRQQNNHAVDQKVHLERINQQLQAYLVAQYQNQLEMDRYQKALAAGLPTPPKPEPVKPNRELSDYLYAQSLLAQYQALSGDQSITVKDDFLKQAYQGSNLPYPDYVAKTVEQERQELADAAKEEVFGRHVTQAATIDPGHVQSAQTHGLSRTVHATRNYLAKPLEINPLRVAYAKLPMAMRNRKFGRPHFHDHSAKVSPQPAQQQTF